MDDASNDKTIGRTNLSGSPVRVAQRQQTSFDKNPLSSTTASDNATLSTQVVANNETAAATSKPLVYTAPPAGGSGGGGSSSFEWPTNADHYQLINRIGQGAFASVWRARIIRSRNADDNNNENDEGDNTAAVESNKTDEIHCAIKIMDLEHVNINISGEL
jgi:hypothetical protein